MCEHMVKACTASVGVNASPVIVKLCSKDSEVCVGVRVRHIVVNAFPYELGRKDEAMATQNSMRGFMGRKLKVFASECSLIATSAYFVDFMSFHQPSISKDHAMASRN